MFSLIQKYNIQWYQNYIIKEFNDNKSLAYKNNDISYFRNIKKQQTKHQKIDAKNI